MKNEAAAALGGSSVAEGGRRTVPGARGIPGSASNTPGRDVLSDGDAGNEEHKVSVFSCLISTKEIIQEKNKNSRNFEYRKYRSLGTPPRLTFQVRLLHNQEGANAEKGGFRKISSRAFFRRIGRCSHPLGCGAIEPGKSV